MKRNKNFIILTLLVTIISLFCISCSTISNTRKHKTQNEFDQFLNRVFTTEVQRDSLTLNYSVSNPKNYGINNSEISLGHCSASYMQDMLMVSENYLATLGQFDYDRLSDSQQLSYDILKSDLELEQTMGNFILYNEYLRPTSGIQSQLPVLLAEYNFYSKEDIDTYIKLLPKIYDYFEEIAEFERQKSKAGLFMSDDVADNIIEQCESFISNKKNNYMIESFNDRVANYKGLKKSEVAAYQKANKNAILKYVIPAYELLISTLEELKGTGINDGGLCNYPKGKEYYEYLIRTNTGSSRSMEDLIKMLDDSIKTNLLKLGNIMNKDSSIYDKAMNITFPYTEPTEIINYLKTEIQKDFPTSPKVNCSIKYVHDSLEDYLSPAMYLIPAIDNYKDNTIYINANPNYDLSQIFPTIAHEGYPGHLYQSVYFRNLNPAYIRNLLDFGGYVEGWATYVEYYSYHYAKLDENVAEFIEASMTANMSLYCRLDMGIHYQGWNLSDTAKYLKNYGIEDSKTVKVLYSTMIEEPALYPQYGIGYLEIVNLKNTAKKELGEKFAIKDFHKFVLDIGPAPFDIIGDRLNDWIESRK